MPRRKDEAANLRKKISNINELIELERVLKIAVSLNQPDQVKILFKSFCKYKSDWEYEKNLIENEHFKKMQMKYYYNKLSAEELAIKVENLQSNFNEFVRDKKDSALSNSCTDSYETTDVLIISMFKSIPLFAVVLVIATILLSLSMIATPMFGVMLVLGLVLPWIAFSNGGLKEASVIKSLKEEIDFRNQQIALCPLNDELEFIDEGLKLIKEAGKKMGIDNLEDVDRESDIQNTVSVISISPALVTLVQQPSETVPNVHNNNSEDKTHKTFSLFKFPNQGKEVFGGASNEAPELVEILSSTKSIFLSGS